MFRFLWSGKAELIKRESLIRELSDGGVGMPQIAGKCRALFMEKLKALNNVENEKVAQPWIGYGIYKLGIPLRRSCPLIARNNFTHNINGTHGVWEEILDQIKIYRITLERKEWVKTSAANIYSKILENGIQRRHTVCAKIYNIDWETVWKNIWKNKILTNKEKELYFKLVQGSAC
jgi:hypothetical protein